MDILRFDDLHKIMPKILPLTSDFRSKFPWLRALKNKTLRILEEHIFPAESLNRDYQTERTADTTTDRAPHEKRKLKSIIVYNSKEDTEMGLDELRSKR